jgi:hypothetical protein
MERREFSGAVLRTNLSANITDSSSTISVVDASSYPTGVHSFVIVLDRGTVYEEKVLIGSRVSNTFTADVRGYDGTTAVAHTTGAWVDHVLDAVTMQDMNKTTYDNEILVWMGV